MEYSPNHELKGLIELVSNVNDAFTAALFLFNPQRDRLLLSAYHTLSLQVNPKTTIQPGDSLIGWVAKNEQPVNVAQFDRDNRNLKLYLRDEGIKSFMAVPVGDAGVLCVDSKRNYVFIMTAARVADSPCSTSTRSLPVVRRATAAISAVALSNCS